MLTFTCPNCGLIARIRTGGRPELYKPDMETKVEIEGTDVQVQPVGTGPGMETKYVPDDDIGQWKCKRCSNDNTHFFNDALRLTCRQCGHGR